MKKTCSILFFIILFYIIPLLGKPELLFHWQVLFLAGISTILYASQPRLSIAESKEKKANDRNTVCLIILISGIAQIVQLMEWAYFPNLLPVGVSTTITTSTGIVMMITGTLFRLYSIRVLGKYFSSTIQIKKGHQLISSGPYRYLRHPSYTGAYIAMLGSAIFLQSIFGMIIFGIGMLIVYHLRIEAEEKTMSDQFQEQYFEYCRRTKRMFPFIW